MIEKLIKDFFWEHHMCVQPVLEISVDYIWYSSDYVEHADVGNLETLRMSARSYAQYFSFFKEVAKLMGTQCDMPAGSSDLQIKLSPVFRISFYISEKDYEKKKPCNHSFVKFIDKFYEDVHKFRCDG